MLLVEPFVHLREVQNPPLEVIKYADLHCMEKVGLWEGAHDGWNMLRHVESSVNMVWQEFGIGSLGVGIADVGCYTEGNLQAMLLQPVGTSWSHHLHTDDCNTHSRCWNFVQRWQAGVPAEEPCSAPLSLFAAAQPAPFEEYCGSWLELAGERALRSCTLRSSSRSSKLDCQLS